MKNEGLPTSFQDPVLLAPNQARTEHAPRARGSPSEPCRVCVPALPRARDTSVHPELTAEMRLGESKCPGP